MKESKTYATMTFWAENASLVVNMKAGCIQLKIQEKDGIKESSAIMLDKANVRAIMGYFRAMYRSL